MEFIYYLTFYLGIGGLLMVILDLMHAAVKHELPDDINSYTNGERLYVIVAWPVFLYGLYMASKNNNNKDGE